MNRWLKLGALVLYFAYVHVFYYVLLVPAFAEYSYYAFLLVPLVLAGFWLVPRELRRRAAVLTLLYVFADQAITNVRVEGLSMLLLTVVVLFLFLYPLTRWYAGLKWAPVAAAIVLALAVQLVVPVRTMQTLTEMRPVWVSEAQYLGEFYGHLPFNVVDLDGDGRDEIVTLGNRDFYPESRRLPKGYPLYVEPTRVVAWTWQDGAGMTRMDEGSFDAETVAEWLPHEYIGYPYYVVNEHFEIEPLVERIGWATGLVQFGTAPFRAMALNVENIDRQLELSGGVYDRLSSGGALFEDVVIQGGVLSGLYDGAPFEVETGATQISDVVRMADGREGLLLKGYNVELLQFEDGAPQVTHVLTRAMQRDLSYSQLRAEDVDGDSADEIVIAYPYPAILKPADEGRWDILWAVDDKRTLNISFQIKDFAQFETADAGAEEILAFSRSQVRASQTNYLTSFTYTDEGLEQNWKVFARGMDLVKSGDLDGDGRDELIVTYGGSSQIYVFAKHDIPVTWIAIGLTVALFAGLLGRRVLYGARSKSKPQE